MNGTYRYIGKGHPFYQYGESYTLHIHKTIFGRIKVATPHGYNFLDWETARKNYRNETAFKADWVEEQI